MRMSLQIHRAESFALWGCAIASAVTAASFLPRAVAVPDLVLGFNDKDPYIETQYFGEGNCAVDEGCVKEAGDRILLRFDTVSKNLGTTDVHFGDPKKNDLFTYHDCHNHYHFDYFAHYRLRENRSNGKIVEEGNKAGFCLMDSGVADKDIARRARSTKTYDCKNQGISAGFLDLYKSTVDCQWIDITDVKPGKYILELEVNPIVGSQRRIKESNYKNNIVTTTVVIRGSGHSVSDRHPTDKLTQDDRKCRRYSMCLKCMGNCDGSDKRCMGDLKCMKRDAKEKVPGCRGRGRKGWDYCYDPADEDDSHGDGDGGKTLSKKRKKCRTWKQCGECEGDCDGRDGRCKGSLVCMERNGNENVPGCRGDGRRGLDYCYRS